MTRAQPGVELEGSAGGAGLSAGVAGALNTGSVSGGDRACCGMGDLLRRDRAGDISSGWVGVPSGSSRGRDDGSAANGVAGGLGVAVEMMWVASSIRQFAGLAFSWLRLLPGR
jgi:hypothetical protein